MDTPKKKTPKNSRKKDKKYWDKAKYAIIALLFSVFAASLIYTAYSSMNSEKNAAAFVNREKVTIGELDWWYSLSVLPQHKDIITKRDFLETSLIPQEILLQKARKERIKSTDEDVEKMLGSFISSSGLTIGEFRKHLKSEGHTINDVKKSFKTRAVIIKLLEKDNVAVDDSIPGDGVSFQNYIDNLINNSDIRIVEENINRINLKGFEAANDEACYWEKKLVIRLYTSSWCKICDESIAIFNEAISGFAGSGKIKALHWNLDTGDNLLTSDKENGIPEEELKIFEKYSPKSFVPVTILGCKYARIGSLAEEDKDEIKIILNNLIGE